MSDSAQFLASAGKPLRVVQMTSGTGTFVPLVDQSRCWVRMMPGGNGGKSADFASPSVTSGKGGDGGNAGSLHEVMLRVPIAGAAWTVGAGGPANGLGGSTSFLGHTVRNANSAGYIPPGAGGPGGPGGTPWNNSGSSPSNGSDGSPGDMGFSGGVGAANGTGSYPGGGGGGGGGSFYGPGGPGGIGGNSGANPGSDGSSPSAGSYGAGGGGGGGAGSTYTAAVAQGGPGIGGCIEVWEFGA